MNSYLEWLNEKFVEDSDAVSDMGIGIEYAINEFTKKFLFPYQYNSYDDKMRVCISHNKIEFIKYLINKVSDINYNNGKFLELAIKYEKYKIAQLLIDIGADVNIYSSVLLKRAADYNSNIKIFELLIDNGIKINNIWTNYIFKLLAKNARLDIIQLLIKNGLNLKNKKLDLDDVLTSAAFGKADLDTMEYIVNLGAKPSPFLLYNLKNNKNSRRSKRVTQILTKHDLI